MRLPFGAFVSRTRGTPASITRPLPAFSLVELLVSIGIMLVIMSVAIVNHQRFQGTLAITNLAYEIALSIRQAQVYGVSVREFSSQANVNYGVAFGTSDLSSYVLFADLDLDALVDTSPNEAVETARMTGGNRITKFCGISPGGGETCGPASLTTLSVTFARPNPDAIVTGRVGAGSPISYSGARIYVATPSGDTRCVLVRTTGQVAVEASCPP